MRVELSGLKLLVLDDSAHMITLLGAIFLGFGIREITRARTADLAMRAVNDGRVDLAVVDKHLDGEDGFAFIRTARTRTLSANPRIPIIALSAHTSKQVVMEAVLSGATDVLCKPVSLRTLYDHVVDAVLKPRPFVECQGLLVPIPRGVSPSDTAHLSPEGFLYLVAETAERRLHADPNPVAVWDPAPAFWRAKSPAQGESEAAL